MYQRPWVARHRTDVQGHQFIWHQEAHGHIIDTGSVKSALISKCHWHTSLEDKESTIRPTDSSSVGLP
jgi:hypothetical protein